MSGGVPAACNANDSGLFPLGFCIVPAQDCLGVFFLRVVQDP
jgi:hypothetical protein